MIKSYRARQDKARHAPIARNKARIALISREVFGEAKSNPSLKDVKDMARAILSF